MGDRIERKGKEEDRVLTEEAGFAVHFVKQGHILQRRFATIPDPDEWREYERGERHVLMLQLILLFILMSLAFVLGGVLL